MKEKFKVTGMTCSACSSRVEKTVSKLEGTDQVSVNLLTGTMQVSYDDNLIDDGKIIEAVEKAGYGAGSIDVRVHGTHADRKAYAGSAPYHGTAAGRLLDSYRGAQQEIFPQGISKPVPRKP